MATNSPELPTFSPYAANSNNTVQSPSVMLKNDENFIHKHRRRNHTRTHGSSKKINFVQRFILSLPIFHPFGTFKRCWNFIITLMLIYIAIETPISFVAASNIWTYINFYSVSALIIDGFLFIDIIITFRTARFFKYDHLKLEDNAFKIAKRYLFGSFLIDLTTAFPYQLVFFSHEYLVVFTILRSLKLIRLYNMMKQSTSHRSITSTTKGFRSFVRIFKLACAVLLIIHYTACIWWWEGEDNSPSWMDAEEAQDLGPFEKYSYSLYFVVTIKFVKATNVIEQWITIIHTLIGTATLSYFIGTLSSMISKGDRIKTQKELRLGEAQAFCDQYQLPTKMTRAILAHLKYHCANNYIFDKDKIFDNVPAYLYKMVAKQLAQRVVNKITFFKPLRSHVRGLIAINMREISCNAGHKLFKKGDKCNKIYIQRTGISKLIFHDGTGHKMKKRRGDIFGEDALCTYLSVDFDAHVQTRAVSTLQCTTWSEFYVINIDDVIHILKSEFGNNWRDKLKDITKIIAVKTNIYNNRYTPRHKIPNIDLAVTHKAEKSKSFKSLFVFNEYESIIRPQLGEMQISVGDETDNNISPFAGDSDAKIQQMDTIQIEAQTSKSVVIQLADIKSNNSNSYQSVAMEEHQSDDESDDVVNESDDSDDDDNDNDNDIRIVIEETKQSQESISQAKTDDMDGKVNSEIHTQQNINGRSRKSLRNLFKKKSHVSPSNMENENKGKYKKHKNGTKKKEEAIDRSTTLSMINPKPIVKRKNNSYFKPRSNSFSISDDYAETKPKPKRHRNHSFNLRRSYFKKTKSEIRDRRLSIEFDGTSIAKLKIPNVPEIGTIYKIDEDMD